jgi:hypothetical protein
MQAMDGLALLRLRTRMIGCALVVALALSALVLFAPNARAGEPPLKTLIGSGTDVTFGYSQELFNENYPLELPQAFTVGKKGLLPALNGVGTYYYVKLETKQLTTNLLQHSLWLPGINDACPFETTDSYIGNGPLGKALEGAIPGAHGGAPCAWHNVTGYHLSHEYRSGQSQLENVLELIASNNTGLAAATHPVQLVALDLGVNDLLHAVAKCEKEVEEGKWPGNVNEGPLTECAVRRLPTVIKHVQTNISAAVYAIRNGRRFGGVDYTGKVIFGGLYNPTGAVVTPGVELISGSNFLTVVINIVLKKTVTPFGVCYVDPQRDPVGAPTFARAFNPLMDGKPELEPERLQKWTNMANTSTAINPLALVDQYHGKNGPDIHPTPTGDEEIANLIEEECP